MLTTHLLPDLLGALPAALYTTDADGLITYYNEAAAELWGGRPVLGDSRWCGCWRLYGPDGAPLPHDECPMAIAVKQDRSLKGVEIVAERPNGTRVPLLAYPTPLHENGVLVGAVNVLVDISARKQSEAFTRQILQSSQDCIKVLDLDGRLLSINACGRRALEITDEEAALGGRYLDFWQDDDRPAAEAAMQDALAGGPGRFTACFRTPSGGLTWWDEIITPIVGIYGKPERLLVISRDITEQKRSSEQREVLIKELDHRVKNTLATVQSIANATMPDAPAVQAYFGRLRALAQAHGLLAETRWEGGCLEAIVNTVVSPYPERVRTRGGAVRLSPRAAQTMCMVLHELTTNAVKHGALSGDDGIVEISWCVSGEANDTALELVWRETGASTGDGAGGEPAAKGFGCLLIEQSVPFDLGGEVQMDLGCDGLVCTIRLPLAGNVVKIRGGLGSNEWRPEDQLSAGERATPAARQLSG